MNQQPVPETPQAKKEGSTGSTIAIIVIILILIAGGYYYYTTGINPASVPSTGDPATTDAVAALNEQGTSDNLGDIETDLNATDLSGLDDASAGFESELQPQ